MISHIFKPSIFSRLTDENQSVEVKLRNGYEFNSYLFHRMFPQFLAMSKRNKSKSVACTSAVTLGLNKDVAE